MLVLSRKLGQVIVVPQHDLTVTVVAVEGKKVRLGISAPEEIDVYREELWRRISEASDQSSAGPPRNFHSINDRATALQNLAAELTTAAYAAVIRHGVGHKWLELQLALWKALTDEIKKAEGMESGCFATPIATTRISNFLG